MYTDTKSKQIESLGYFHILLQEKKLLDLFLFGFISATWQNFIGLGLIPEKWSAHRYNLAE